MHGVPEFALLTWDRFGPTAAAHSDGVDDRFAATAEYFLLQTTLKGVTVIDHVPFREGALWSFDNQ